MIFILLLMLFFFFKQKTAYEMRISDWSSDVCSSDLAVGTREALAARYPDAARLDVGASTVVPGLIDAHGHVEGLGYTKLRVDLVGARSSSEERRVGAECVSTCRSRWSQVH